MLRACLILVVAFTLLLITSHAQCEDPLVDCSANGFCRDDGTCMCDPEYFGADCSKQLKGTGMTEADLAFTIIGGIIMLPLGLICFYYLVNSDFEMPSMPSRPQPARQQSNRNNLRRPSIELEAPVQQRISIHHNNASEPDVMAVAAPAPDGLGDTAEQKVQINYVSEVFENELSREVCRKALVDNNWNTPQAVNSLLNKPS